MTKMTYVKCPICGETDTDKTEYENGLVIISCSNIDCASNGGSNYSFLKKTLDEKANPSLQLDIVHRGTSGIEIQALLSKKYSLIEYSLKAEPVPILPFSLRIEHPLNVLYKRLSKLMQLG